MAMPGASPSNDRFSEIASIDYPILDADAHVNEPPDTWQDRVPAKWRDRAPKVVHTDRGDRLRAQPEPGLPVHAQ